MHMFTHSYIGAQVRNQFGKSSKLHITVFVEHCLISLSKSYMSYTLVKHIQDHLTQPIINIYRITYIHISNICIWISTLYSMQQILLLLIY